jgi:hypothetical protein
MSTKTNPSKDFDCYANAEPDEPMFVLLGRDRHAPQLVEMWASMRATAGEDPAKVLEALKCAKAMRKHRYERKGAPVCEYCESSGDSDCTKTSTKLVSEDGLLWSYWCAGAETFLARDARVQTIDEYFTTDGVDNEYCNDEGLRVYYETRAMRARANEAVMGDDDDTHVDDPDELPDYGGGMSGG